MLKYRESLLDSPSICDGKRLLLLFRLGARALQLDETIFVQPVLGELLGDVLLVVLGADFLGLLDQFLDGLDLGPQFLFHQHRGIFHGQEDGILGDLGEDVLGLEERIRLRLGLPELLDLLGHSSENGLESDIDLAGIGDEVFPVLDFVDFRDDIRNDGENTTAQKAILVFLRLGIERTYDLLCHTILGIVGDQLQPSLMTLNILIHLQEVTHGRENIHDGALRDFLGLNDGLLLRAHVLQESGDVEGQTHVRVFLRGIGLAVIVAEDFRSLGHDILGDFFHVHTSSKEKTGIVPVCDPLFFADCFVLFDRKKKDQRTKGFLLDRLFPLSFGPLFFEHFGNVATFFYNRFILAWSLLALYDYILQ